MSIHEPTPGGITEVSEHKLGSAKSSSGRGRKPHTIISETYNVLLTVAVNVRSCANVLVNAPTLVIPEVCDNEGRSREAGTGGK